MSRNASRRLPPALLLCALALTLAAAFAGTAGGAENHPLALTPPPPPAVLPFGREIAVAANASTPVVAGFADGSWLAVWRHANGTALRARRFGADDRPLGAAFTVGPATAPPGAIHAEAPPHGRPAVASLGGGQWALAWSEAACDGCAAALYLSLYDGATPLVERQLVDAGAGDRFGPVLATAADGGFVVGWTVDNLVPPPQLDGSNFSDAYARIYAADGQPLGDRFRVNEDLTEEQNLTGALALPGGDLVFTWDSYEGESGFYDVYHRRFNATGFPLGGEAQVNGEEGAFVRQYESTLAPAGGGYVVVWTDWYPAPMAHPEAVWNGTTMARFYDRDGVAFDGDFAVSATTPPGDRRSPAAAGAADGSFVVLWVHGCAADVCASHPDSPDGSLSGVRAVSFGQFWNWGNTSEELTVNRVGVGEQTAPAVAAVGSGQYVAVWLSQPVPGGPQRLVARRFARLPCFGPTCLQPHVRRP